MNDQINNLLFTPIKDKPHLVNLKISKVASGIISSCINAANQANSTVYNPKLFMSKAILLRNASQMDETLLRKDNYDVIGRVAGIEQSNIPLCNFDNNYPCFIDVAQTLDKSIEPLINKAWVCRANNEIRFDLRSSRAYTTGLVLGNSIAFYISQCKEEPLDVKARSTELKLSDSNLNQCLEGIEFALIRLVDITTIVPDQYFRAFTYSVFINFTDNKYSFPDGLGTELVFNEQDRVTERNQMWEREPDLER